MPKEMLISACEGEECRLAIIDDGVLQEIYAERESEDSQVGNIYAGRVANVEPSIQAAFVDFGSSRHGFLHISDVQAQYFPKAKRLPEPVGKKISRKDRPAIQECLRRGQEVVCQVIKAGIGAKGPTLTTYLSIPGRFIVMMPGMSRLGVSQKIEDDEERSRLRTILQEINPPDDIGFIARTASMGRTKRDLQADLQYLQRLWRSVERRMKKAKAPAELFEERDLVIRTIRDVYSSEIDRIICDSEVMTHKVADFLKVAMPRGKNVVQFYTGGIPLFYRYGLEHEIEKIYSRHVELPNGSSLVIDQTEALVAIDVNSGRSRSAKDAEETAFRTNMTAAKEVARQLRLRDLGGVIVIDFIDMRFDRHQRELERTMRDLMKKDRARSKLLRLSAFGLLQMTRQRIRPGLKSSIFSECPHCKGAGLIQSPESLAIAIMRNLQLACADTRINTIDLTVSAPVAEFLSNRRRAQLAQLERESDKTITVRTDPTISDAGVTIECRDDRGGLIPWQPPGADEPQGPLGPRPKDVPAQGPPSKTELVDASQLPGLPTPVASPDEPDNVDEWEELDELKETKPDEDIASAEPVQADRAPEQGADGETEGPPKKRRRRRGGRKHRRKTPAPVAGQAPETTALSALPAETGQAQPAEPVESVAEPPPTDGSTVPAEQDDQATEAETKRKRRRPGGRRQRHKKATEAAESQTPDDVKEEAPAPAPEGGVSGPHSPDAAPLVPPAVDQPPAVGEPTTAAGLEARPPQEMDATAAKSTKPTRRRRPRKANKAKAPESGAQTPAAADAEDTTAAEKQAAKKATRKKAAKKKAAKALEHVEDDANKG